MASKQGVYCANCHVYIHPTEKVVMVAGIPYHDYHRPKPVKGMQEQELQRQRTPVRIH